MSVGGVSSAGRAQEAPSLGLLFRREVSEFFSVRPVSTGKPPKKPEDFNTISYGDSGDSGLYLLA